MLKTTGKRVVLLGLCLLHAGCTLIMNADRQQCEKDADCAKHGAAYANYTCDRLEFVCIAPAGSAGAGSGGSVLGTGGQVGGGSGGRAGVSTDGGLAGTDGSLTFDGMGLGGSRVEGDSGSSDSMMAAGGRPSAGGSSLDSSADAHAPGGSAVATGGGVGQAGGNSGGATTSAGSGGSPGGTTVVLGLGGSTYASTGGTAAGGSAAGGTAAGGAATGGAAAGGAATSSGGDPGSGGATISSGGNLGSGGNTTAGGATTASGGNLGSGGDSGGSASGGSASGGSASGGSASGGTSSAPDGGSPSDAGGVDAFTSSATVVSLSLGANHSCAVTRAGGAWCWGDDAYGQIGDSTVDSIGRYAPGAVTGLSSGVIAVSAGAYHTCAVTTPGGTTPGGVKCWGRGDSGQLGDGSTSSMRSRPVDVVDLSAGVVAVAAGTDHTCALLSTGGVRCWGDNSVGQLGLGNNTSQTTPADVPTLSGVLSISAGDQFTCAATATGAWCWGRGDSGQLGNGNIMNQNRPTSVLGSLPSGVGAVSAGASHACALLSAGGVKCWGSNFYDQLGKGTTSSAESIPVDVAGLSAADGSGPAAAVAAGSGHTCALLKTGELRCWGAGTAGQLGLGADNSYQSAPGSVPGLPGASTIAAGGMMNYGHTCAALASGGLECWGYNSSGQVGCGSCGMEVRSPVLVPGL